ncbi:MAG: hypothetical protein Kow0065_23120 [Methylomicrobium sp.]
MNDPISDDRAVREDDSAESASHVLLIDLENCPKQVHQLLDNLASYSYVVICYAQCGARVPLDWIVPLTATVNQNRLKIIKMPNGGKNSADFGITFWAGVMMAQLPENTHFDVVSDDNDLDHAVSLLVSQGRSAQRIGVKLENLPGSAPKSLEVAVQEFCAHLIKHSRSRPVKKETLLNSIRSKFKNSVVDAEDLFEALVKQKVIAVADNKVSYNQLRIDNLSESVNIV